ncbi:unnamed protein product [Zymoseptoria tritici ST99CH_1A5]|uniref:Methyltransferase type 11 domain-containing protein n=1 Tax=Zymoseptoria tritici ST99CH_1A5 TaxID=1276529 RepID=A0A1Y6LHI7_ZYMTR|nr:unnamed protein product [Zymoseptoria tritici ST99CH_1A5]
MADWPSYIATVHDLLAPGGYFEMHELNYDFYSGITGEVISESWSWLQTCRSAMEGRGLDPRSASKAHTWMAEAGFRDVVVKQYRWPFGGEWEEDEKWKAWGDYVATSMPELFWVMIGRILEGTAGKEVVERTREQMMADLRPEKGKEWRMSVVVGRKAGEE